MKPDLYTKAVLTVIALALMLIACNQYAHPSVTARAEGPFAGVQFSSDHGPAFFDTRTGEVSLYDWGGALGAKLRLTTPGGSLLVICNGAISGQSCRGK
jgi:hypothetical protein